jgi:hypothetical protein
MTTPFFRARVRRSSVVELIVIVTIVTIVTINTRLRRRRDWRDWEMFNGFRWDVLELLTCPHTLLPSARLTIIVITLSKGIRRIAHRSSSVYSHDDENVIAPRVTRHRNNHSACVPASCKAERPRRI